MARKENTRKNMKEKPKLKKSLFDKPLKDKQPKKSEGISKESKLIFIMLAISLISLSVSTIIQYREVKSGTIFDSFCSSGSKFDCEYVQHSKYGKIGGIDLSVFGILGFLFLSFLLIFYLIGKNHWIKMLIISGSTFAGLASIALLLIQMFALQKYCAYCLVVDFCSFALLIFSFLLRRA